MSACPVRLAGDERERSVEDDAAPTEDVRVHFDRVRLALDGLEPGQREPAVASCLSGADGCAFLTSLPFSSTRTLKPTFSPGFVPEAYARRGTVTVGTTPPLTAMRLLRASTEAAAAVNRPSDGFAAPVRVRRPLCHRLVAVAEDEPDEHVDPRVLLGHRECLRGVGRLLAAETPFGSPSCLTSWPYSVIQMRTFLRLNQVSSDFSNRGNAESVTFGHFTFCNGFWFAGTGYGCCAQASNLSRGFAAATSCAKRPGEWVVGLALERLVAACGRSAADRDLRARDCRPSRPRSPPRPASRSSAARPTCLWRRTAARGRAARFDSFQIE